MVLVVLLPLAHGELENGACDTPEEDSLLHAVFLGVSQVREQGTVEYALDLLRPVLLRLSCGEVPLQERYCVLLGVVAVGSIVLLIVTALDVGIDDVGHVPHVLVGDYGLVDLPVILHPQRPHYGDQGYGGRGDRYGDRDHAVLLLLDQGQGAVPFSLGEDLSNLDGGAVLLIVLDHDPVGGKILQRYEHPLRPSDYEVPSGVHRVLLPLYQELVVLLIGHLALLVGFHHAPVQIAAFGPDHHGEVAYANPLRLLLDPVLYDCEINVYGGHVVEVPEPCLHRRELVAVAVGLHDAGFADANGGFGLYVYVTVLVPLPADAYLDVPSVRTLGVEPYGSAVGVVGRDPYVIDDLLHAAVGIVIGGQEVVERRGVVIYYAALIEVELYEISHPLSPL